MGKLEGWLARNLGALKPRFRIAESIRSGLEKLKDSVTQTTDIADFVKIEDDNHSLKKEVRELTAIIADMKAMNSRPRPGEEPDIVFGNRRPDPPPAMRPAQNLVNSLAPERLSSIQEQVLQAELDRVRRELAAVTGKLNNIVELGRQTLETRPFITNPEAQALLIAIMSVAQPGLFVTLTHPYPENREAMTFDDSKPKAVIKPMGNDI